MSKNKSLFERYKFRSKMIQTAIDQNKRGYTQKTDQRTSEFHRKFYEYVNKNFPELEMRNPIQRASGQTWISFLPKELKNKMKIKYKGDRGFVDLDFKCNTKYHKELEKKWNTDLEKTKKSLSKRIISEKIDPYSTFKSQVKNVNKVLKNAKKLFKFGIGLKRKNLV